MLQLTMITKNMPLTRHATTHEDHEKHAAAPAGHHEAAKHAAMIQPKTTKKPDKHATASGLIDIGEGFFVKNIKFEPFGSSSQISGEIINKSDRDHGMTDFKVQAYDKENVPLGDQGFSVYGFSKGTTKTF